ncbi:hypothetical protein B0H14DRAFT_3479322 [Mycena olivaceomarginata]|nr:hypothetical protein B0H14DRAFT_3520217 [Mycena olivaceomarginata]KAJ7811908.1 hypothetical protein B0H14DRAFT_3479322 [Mycena olivaceomarginata]
MANPHLRYELHTHIHHHIYDDPPAMAAFASSTSTKTSTPTELEALVALVALSTATMDVVRLTAEVQAKLPAVVAGEVVAARAATAAAQAAQAAQAEATATDPAPDAADPLWVRGTPKTPAQLELQYPEGSGETWYVVICGREPGMYRTAAEADSNCNKVPNQLKAKKTSRLEALAWYRREYHGPLSSTGVQKWTPA